MVNWSIDSGSLARSITESLFLYFCSHNKDSPNIESINVNKLNPELPKSDIKLRKTLFSITLKVNNSGRP